MNGKNKKRKQMSVVKYNSTPKNSLITKGLEGKINYMDSFRVQIENPGNFSVDYITAMIFTSIPQWGKCLFKLRDILVNVYITTVVQFNNFFGHAYFFPVKPLHKFIIKNLCKGLKKNYLLITGKAGQSPVRFVLTMRPDLPTDLSLKRVYSFRERSV